MRSRRPALWTLSWLTLWLVGSLIVSGCRRTSETAPNVEPIAVWKPRDWSQFVGSEACRECHAEICDRYEAHPMAQALSLANSEDDMIENFEAGAHGFTTSARERFVVEQRDGQVWHLEQELADDGQSVVAQQAEPMLYAMGSGIRGRSYLLVEDGKMYESPISWYSSEQVWDLSPGYPPESHNRFNREIAGRCLLCHCGLPSATVGNGPDVFAYQEPYVREFGISCERCHGTGAEHIAFHRSSNRQGTDPIVNPMKLDPGRRDDVCNQCHLLGEDAVLRYGRKYDDFRPGDRLGDVWALFVRGTDVDTQGRTQAVSHVQQSHASVCFKQSQGQLGCATCHDPHGVPVDKVAHYRQACFKCHDGPDSCAVDQATRRMTHPDDSCVACHMPSIAANDIPHTSQTDHRILRDPLSGPKQAISDIGTLEDWEIFGEEQLDWSSAERNRVLGIAWGNFAASGNDVVAAKRAIELLEPLRSTFQKDAALQDILAYCYFITGDRSRAQSLWMEALQSNPELPTAHYSLASLKMQEGALGEAREHLRVYVEQKPRQVAMIFRLSQIEAQLLNDAEALRWAERALSLDPSDSKVRQWRDELQSRVSK